MPHLHSQERMFSDFETAAVVCDVITSDFGTTCGSLPTQRAVYAVGRAEKQFHKSLQWRVYFPVQESSVSVHTGNKGTKHR